MADHVCWLCEEPILDDDIHTDDATGEDVHGLCCRDCPDF